MCAALRPTPCNAAPARLLAAAAGEEPSAMQLAVQTAERSTASTTFQSAAHLCGPRPSAPPPPAPSGRGSACPAPWRGAPQRKTRCRPACPAPRLHKGWQFLKTCGNKPVVQRRRTRCRPACPARRLHKSGSLTDANNQPLHLNSTRTYSTSFKHGSIAWQRRCHRPSKDRLPAQ